MGHRRSAAILVAAAALLVVAAIAAQGRRAVVDEAGFTERAANAAAQVEVRDEIAARLGHRMAQQRAWPATGRRLLDEAVADAVHRDPRFGPALRAGAIGLHRALFDPERPAATLEIPGAGRLLGSALEAGMPGLDPRLTAPAGDPPPLLVLGGGGALERGLRRAAPTAATLAAWWPAAAVLAAALLVLTALRAPSRRSGLRRAALATALAGGVTAGLTVGPELVLLGTFTTPHGEAVVDALWDAYLADLRTAGLVVAAAGLAAALLSTARRPGTARAAAR